MTKRREYRRKFDKSFKMQAIKMLLEEHLPIVEIAKRLDVNQTQIHKWKQEFETHGKEAFPGKGRQTAEEEENRRLRKRLADAEEERDILKKALAIFSKAPEESSNS
jgi:transposase